MSSIIIPNSFVSQPPGFATVDHGHPLANGLELGGLPSTTGAVACGLGRAGSVVLVTPDTAMGDRLRKGTALFGLYRHQDIAIDNKTFATMSTIGASWSSNIEMLFHATYGTSSATAQKTCFTHNDPTQDVLGYGSLSAPGVAHWVFQYDGSTASPWAKTLWNTNLYRAHNAYGTFPWNTGNSRVLSIGNTAAGFYGVYALWYSRILSATEITKIQGNPWQLFKAPK